MRNIIFFILVLGLGGVYYFSTPPSDTDWINGEWVIETKIEESNIQNFTFYPDETMIFGNSNGTVYDDCAYSFFSKSTIDFECNINGKKAVFPLEVSNNKSTITMTNGNRFIKAL